jgi:hypothetical protein
MIKHRDSHVDHGLAEAQLRYLLDRFADRESFFLETVELPSELGTVPCGLWGPAMGDSPVAEGEVIYAHRGQRTWASRLVERPTRPTRLVTVVAGPHEEPCLTCRGDGLAPGSSSRCPEDRCEGGKLRHACVLYTAFGGPSAPQEPEDPGCKDLAKSSAFWRAHALAK